MFHFILASTVWVTGSSSVGGKDIAASPRVVVSIAPLHSLVAAVMGDVGTPHLIVHGYASPHTYNLRPSDARKLAQADLILWIGGQLEVFLRKPIGALRGNAQVVEMLNTPGLDLRANRTGGVWETAPHDHGEAVHRQTRDNHAPVGGIDPHIWLDPANAVLMVRFIASTLGRVDPPNRDRYLSNATHAERSLQDLDQSLERRFRPFRQVPFLVFHDAFQYLEKRYGLAAMGSVALGPERLPGARRIRELREKIRQTGTGCLFREPQFASAAIRPVTEELDLRTSILDPLGAGLSPGPALYFQLMEANAGQIEACLSY